MTDPTNKIFMLLGQIQADMNAVKEDISEIKLITSDYKTNKNRIIGVCVGVSAAVGGGLSAVLNKLGLHL